MIGIQLNYFHFPSFDDVYLLITIIYFFISVLLYLFYPKANIEFIPEIINSINSHGYSFVLIAVLSITSFIILEYFVDLMACMWKGSILNEYDRKASILPFLILTLVFCSSLIIMYLVIPYNDYFLVLLVIHLRIICLVGATLSYAYSYGGTSWNNPTLIGAYSLTCIGCHLKAIIFYQSTNIDCFKYLMYQIGSVIHIIAILIILGFFLHWFIKIYIHKNISSTLSDDSWKCSVFGLSFLCASLPVLSAQFRYNIFNFPASVMILNELAILSYVIFLYLFESRVLRGERRKYRDELEFKRMFVRYISHEVRTPLNTVLMGLQVLTECMGCGEGDMDNLDTLKDIRASCEIAVNTLNELLTFDKLEGGSLMLERSWVDAHHLIASTVEPFHIQARHTNITLCLRAFPDSSPGSHETWRRHQLYADVTKIAQVIRNLVSNALKFTPPGGAVTVTVDVVKREGQGNLAGFTGITVTDSPVSAMLKVEVADTGVGISAENQKRLFKEIVQFNPGKLQKGGGSGLGLYISANIVALHGGSLSVHSHGEGCGTGSTFTLRLPLLQPEDTTVTSEDLVEIRPSVRTKDVLPGVRVLRRPSVPLRQKGAMSVGHMDGEGGSDGDIIDTKTESGHSDLMVSKLNMGLSIYLREARYSMLQDDLHTDFPGHTDAIRKSHITKYDNMRVLVADDSAMSRKMQSRLLRKRGFECLEAENGKEAVDLIKWSLQEDEPRTVLKIDLVVIDSEMPEMTGPDATHRIRQLGFAGVIIGVTGNVSPEDIQHFIGQGADAVLGKPLDVDNFDRVLENLCNSQRIS